MASSIFTGYNCHTWARSMKRALISKNKFKFVNGLIIKLDEFHPSLDAWERCNKYGGILVDAFYITSHC